jgi:hypothetical protein
MAFDWREYLTLARELQANPPSGISTECAYRCAISKAYFGAFCHARNYARDYLGFQPHDDPDDHGRLRAHLKRSRRAATATRLDNLRVYRNRCDYDDDLGIDGVALVAMLASALADAQYVFDSLPIPIPSAPPPPSSPAPPGS